MTDHLLMACNDPAIRKKVGGHRAHWFLNARTLAELSSLQAGIFILRLGSTDD